MIKTSSKGFVLSLDALVALAVAIILFGLVWSSLDNNSVQNSDSTSFGVPLYLHSTHSYGLFDRVITEYNQTLLDNITDQVSDRYCLNVTVYEDDSYLLSSQSSDCGEGKSVSVWQLFSYHSNSFYRIYVRGWGR